MELEGNLAEFGITSVLQFLCQGNLSGTLTLTHDDKISVLAFRDGKCVYTPGTDTHGKILRMLRVRGAIGPRDIARLRNSGLQFETNLLQQDLMTEERLQSCIQDYLRETISDLLLLTEGQFRFERDEALTATRQGAELDLAAILSDWSQNREEIQAALARIPAGPKPLAVRPLDHGEREQITLTPDEWFVLSLINGFYSVGSIVERSHLGRVSTSRLLAGLLERGVVIEKECPEPQIMPESLLDAPKVPLRDTKPARKPFSFFRKAAPKPVEAPADHREAFYTPVSMIVDLANQWARRLHGQTPLNGHLISDLWHDILMQLPRADLVQCRDGSLTSQSFDAFVRSLGDGNAMQPCYEETIAALSLLFDRLLATTRSTIGEQDWGAFRDALLRDYEEVPRPHTFKAFDFSSFVRNSAEGASPSRSSDNGR